MKIGELAAATATQIETIRFYEREGLLPAPERTAANYRVYGAAHAQRLAFIRRCRSLDMALDEIRALLSFIDAPGADCSEVNRVLDEHIGHVAARIRELSELEAELRELRARCQSSLPGQACEILKQLGQVPAGKAAAPAARAGSEMHAHVGAVHGRRAKAGA